VFSRTKHGADKIVKRLQRDGLPALAIHGNKSQGVRTRVLEQFKGRNPPILVATDIAARGLDIRDVSHIVNYDLPHAPETYVHRIGRTARAGGAGTAISFCASDERGLLRQIESLINCRIVVEQAHERQDRDLCSQEVRPAAPVAVEQPPRRRVKQRTWPGSRRSSGA
jgi:ATP-dependent RNA helicase RhlE